MLSKTQLAIVLMALANSCALALPISEQTSRAPSTTLSYSSFVPLSTNPLPGPNSARKRAAPHEKRFTCVSDTTFFDGVGETKCPDGTVCRDVGGGHSPCVHKDGQDGGEQEPAIEEEEEVIEEETQDEEEEQEEEEEEGEEELVETRVLVATSTTVSASSTISASVPETTEIDATNDGEEEIEPEEEEEEEQDSNNGGGGGDSGDPEGDGPREAGSVTFQNGGGTGACGVELSDDVHHVAICKFFLTLLDTFSQPTLEGMNPDSQTLTSKTQMG